MGAGVRVTKHIMNKIIWRNEACSALLWHLGDKQGMPSQHQCYPIIVSVCLVWGLVRHTDTQYACRYASCTIYQYRTVSVCLLYHVLVSNWYDVVHPVLPDLVQYTVLRIILYLLLVLTCISSILGQTFKGMENTLQ